MNCRRQITIKRPRVQEQGQRMRHIFSEISTKSEFSDQSNLCCPLTSKISVPSRRGAAADSGFGLEFGQRQTASIYIEKKRYLHLLQNYLFCEVNGQPDIHTQYTCTYITRIVLFLGHYVVDRQAIFNNPPYLAYLLASFCYSYVYIM